MPRHKNNKWTGSKPECNRSDIEIQMFMSDSVLKMFKAIPNLLHLQGRRKSREDALKTNHKVERVKRKASNNKNFNKNRHTDERKETNIAEKLRRR